MYEKDHCDQCYYDPALLLVYTGSTLMSDVERGYSKTADELFIQ